MQHSFRCAHLIVALMFCSWAVVSSLFVNETTSGHGGSAVKNSATAIRLIYENQKVIVDNGLLKVTFSIPDGTITGINYGGIDNLLWDQSHGRGYWDANWRRPGQPLSGTTYRVIRQTDDHVELSFSHTADVHSPDVPFNFDKRVVMFRGVSGFYTYAIYERLKGSSDLNLYQTRLAFKLNPRNFAYMALSDTRRRIMPAPWDRTTGRKLAYPEAVLLSNPSNPNLRNEVDDKYAYSAENQNTKVHGWISLEPAVGFWLITPSHEFQGGGPPKQDLTSHVGPVTLAMFMSTHYAGLDLTAYFRNGEPWKKVFGPVFVYLNSNHKDPMALWDDAKRQMWEEVGKWPYDFPITPDFPGSNQRGSVSGQLRVYDRFMGDGAYKWARHAYVGLAAPGPAGSWQTETKDYQFWIQTDGLGRFQISNARCGTYNLYAWVPGYLGDFVYWSTITVTAGGNVHLGWLTFEPPRDGPTLWEIGIPDRSAAEFYIPDPDSMFTGLHKKYNFKKFRDYGLWDRYSVLYPQADLEFTVGHSAYQQDWFYAHVPRRMPDNTYRATIWKIIFMLPSVSPNGMYGLRIAIAAATYAELQVRINDPNLYNHPHFTTGLFGRDNAIARHGIHGLNWLFNIDVPGWKLYQGKNTIYLTQTRSNGPFVGLMYDYLRFEGPA